MMSTEPVLFIGYLVNLLERAGTRQELVMRACVWAVDGCLIGEESGYEFNRLLESLTSTCGDRKNLPPHEVEKVQQLMIRLLRADSPLPNETANTVLACNLDQLGRRLCLDLIEAAFFGLALRYRLYGDFAYYFDKITSHALPAIEACAACLGVETEPLVRVLDSSGRLLSSGALVAVGRDGRDLDHHFQVHPAIGKALLRDTCGDDRAGLPFSVDEYAEKLDYGWRGEVEKSEGLDVLLQYLRGEEP